jgi:hypothetical protein
MRIIQIPVPPYFFSKMRDNKIYFLDFRRIKVLKDKSFRKLLTLGRNTQRVNIKYAVIFWEYPTRTKKDGKLIRVFQHRHFMKNENVYYFPQSLLRDSFDNNELNKLPQSRFKKLKFKI